MLAQPTQNKYLARHELNAILKAAKKRGHRDYAIVLLSYRHALRSAELVALEWNFVDWDRKNIFIDRVKGSDSGYHELAKDEISLLRSLKRKSPGRYIIHGKKYHNLTTTRVRQICHSLSKDADLSYQFHHHQLRHTCAFTMANNPKIPPLVVQRYLGHRSFQSTEVYIREAGRDFKDLGQWWR